jgi:hypothetical protein
MADSLGAKVGTRVAALVARQKLATLAQSTGLFVKTGMALQEEFFRLTGGELARTVGPVYQAIADAAPADGWVKPTAQFLADGRGQLSTLVGISGISSGFGQGVGAVISNDLNPVVTALIRDHPTALLTVPDLAAATAKGLMTLENAAHDAAGQGIILDKFIIEVALAAQTIAPADILELVNRGYLTPDGGLYWMQRAGMDHVAAQAVMALRVGVVSVQDAADMLIKGIVTEDEGRALAALTGFSATSFDQYALVTGEPPDLQTLFLAWRRGIITESDVDRGIRQSRLRDEWIPTAKSMRYVPLSTADVADAVNQGHMSLADATRVADENGITATDFDVVIANAGIPPGPSEALEWVSRGIITQDEFTQIFLESRIKNKYINLYLDSRPRLLTMAEVRLLYRDGAMTADQATSRLQDLGFSAENAGIIINGAASARTAKARDLTRDQVMSLLTDQIITEADALTMLEAMGWSAADAQWIIDLASMTRIQKFINAAISQVQSRYVTRKIDSNTASATLDALNIATDARDNYLALWDIEKGVITKELTTAEIIAAAKKQIITVDDANTRLLGQGYAQDDATIKLAIAGLSTSTTTTGGP